MTEKKDYMAIALREAQEAGKRGEVPIGAVLVDSTTGQVVASDGNRTIELKDPSGHAEILVIREAGRLLDNERLIGCHLYVTLEPCAMCAGAISFARIDKLVFAAPDPKGGAVLNGPRFFEQPTCHHRPEVEQDSRGQEAGELLRDFFKARREGRSQTRKTAAGS